MAGLKPRVWPNSGKGLEFQDPDCRMVYLVEGLFFMFVLRRSNKNSWSDIVVVELLNTRIRSNFPGLRSYLKSILISTRYGIPLTISQKSSGLGLRVRVIQTSSFPSSRIPINGWPLRAHRRTGDILPNSSHLFILSHKMTGLIINPTITGYG